MAALVNLLNHPEHIEIVPDPGVRAHKITIRVHGEDQAFVIGKDARMIRSLQRLVDFMSERNGDTVHVGVADPVIGSGARSFRQFERDLTWSKEQSEKLRSIFDQLVRYVFDDKASVTLQGDRKLNSFIDINIPTQPPMDVITSLQTVIRSIGKSKGRTIVTGVKSP